MVWFICNDNYQLILNSQTRIDLPVVTRYQTRDPFVLKKMLVGGERRGRGERVVLASLSVTKKLKVKCFV